MKTFQIGQLPAKSLLAAALAALLATGCAVTPQPLTTEDVHHRVAQDQLNMYADQEKIEAPITFQEALARSLKYNLDYRLKLMESALNMGLADVAQYDMLPNLLVSAGYTRRNNITASRSFNIIDGEVVEPDTPVYTGGVEKSRRLASAEFSWNVLDFGVGYYSAKQAADKYLIAEERRRRVVQNILQDVRSAYWRAVGAQRMAKDAATLLSRVQSALERSRKAEAAGLIPPRQALTYQRTLLDAVSLLSARRQELELAKRELAALMNVPPGIPFSVADEAEPALPPVPSNVGELEEMAMTNRPELRQEDYQTRITAAEARKQLLHLLPNLNLSLGAQYDSNRYLYNNDWADASARVTFNLFRVLAYPATQEALDGQRKVDETRRMALSMAVLTQVRVAVERYRLALDDFEIAKESMDVDRRMAEYARAALSSKVDSELELIRAETRAINTEFQRHAAYAAAQNAFGRIYNSVGLEVVPEGVDDASLDTVGKRVTDYVAQIEDKTFMHAAAAAAPAPKLSLQVQGVSDPQISNAIEHALTKNHYALEAGPGLRTLTYRLELGAPKDGVRDATWHIRLSAPDGSALGETSYSSTLAAEPTPSSVQAFAEAAALASLDKLGSWLEASNAR